MKECSAALLELKNNKSAGCDGFPMEFYKFFWNKIQNFVYNSYLWSGQNKMLSTNQERGIITLVPKKGKDPCKLKNWQPFSLFNVDYKILTKVLAMRLQKNLNKIISPDQVGYIKGHFIGVNIRTTADILTYCQLNTKEKALISLIDFEKAFDSINWSFLLKSLQTFNFGNSFISWVKTLYTDIESCVNNNGKSSNFFKLERGIRQGCCLSALLFIIVAELLAISIRTNKLIHGVKIQQDEFKICHVADDTTLFLRDTCSLKIVLNLLDEFSVISGLKINKDKTEVFSVNHDSNLGNSLGISWRKNTFKALGVWFSLDENEMTKLNLEN